MKNIFLGLIILCSTALISCGSSNPMVGTWTANESGDITHYLEFNSNGTGTYYFDSKLTGTSSPCKFTYQYKKSISKVLNDEVKITGAHSYVENFSSTVLDGELIVPTMLKTSAITVTGSYSLTFKKR